MLLSGMEEDGAPVVHDILQGQPRDFSLYVAGIERNHPGRPPPVLHPGEIHPEGAAVSQKLPLPGKTQRLLSRLSGGPKGPRATHPPMQETTNGPSMHLSADDASFLPYHWPGDDMMS